MSAVGPVPFALVQYKKIPISVLLSAILRLLFTRVENLAILMPKSAAQNSSGPIISSAASTVGDYNFAASVNRAK
jgi:hypothetical protein